jgi:hypothetical protein
MFATINRLLFFIVALLTVISIGAAPGFDTVEMSPDPVGKGATASSTEVEVRCFSGDSLVTLAKGERKYIGYLQSGDEVLTVDGSKIVNSQIVMMLDSKAFAEILFFTITTASGHGLSLTALHLIPIVSSSGKLDYLPASQVQVGDNLYVVSNGELEQSPVTNVTTESKKGYFAPLTMKGTLLVNGVLVSCFASVKSHEWAQLFMAPFRWYYNLAWLLSQTDPFGSHEMDGVHWVARIMYEFISCVLPETLRLS